MGEEGERIAINARFRDQKDYRQNEGMVVSFTFAARPNDRTAIFKPLGLELSRQMEAAFGTTPKEAGSVDPPTRVPEAKEVIESKIIPCERCGAVAAMLIFAPMATDPGRFEDYARKMYPQYYPAK